MVMVAPDDGDGWGSVRVWDDANIVESFPGITLPLTYSVAREAYASVYRGACRSLGVAQSTLDANAPLFEQLLGHIDGHIYYDVTGWHRLLALLPGFGASQPLMERMMGAARPGAKAAEAAAPVVGPRRGLLEVGRFFLHVGVGVALLGRRAAALERLLADLRSELDARDTERLAPDELMEVYEDLSGRAIGAWHVTILNDLAVMVAHGTLRGLADRWLGQEGQALVNLVLRGDGLASTRPAAELEALAARLRADPALVQRLGAAEDPLELLRTDPGMGELGVALEGYLERWGDRGPRDLQLERPSFREDPAPLLASLLAMASRAGEGSATEPRQDQAQAWRRIGELLGPRLSARRAARLAALRWLAGRARHHLAWRERMRFARTELFALGRRLFGSLDRRMAEAGAMEPGDIWYLDLAEVRGSLRGTFPPTDLRAAAALRRELFAGFERAPRPPHRFETRGHLLARTPAHGAVDPGQGDPVAGSGATWKGIGVGGGRVRGTCRRIVDPASGVVSPGEVIAAYSTDPGWLPMLMSASGLLVERGSLLSHSAIVARELGLPTVVGLAGLMDRATDGVRVELDGTSGEVRFEP